MSGISIEKWLFGLNNYAFKMPRELKGLSQFIQQHIKASSFR
jgi:hypothetical protein